MADKEPADRYPDSEGPFAGPNNTFPLNTAGRVRNAWARIHQGPTMANHSAAEIASIRAKIRARAKELGIELSDDGSESKSGTSTETEMRNTLYRVELRHNGDGARRLIGGYAAKFNSDSRSMPYIERIAPSFFTKTHADGWPGAGGGVVCRYNHDDMHLLGTTRSGTLQLQVNEHGLEYTVDVPEHRQDVLELVARGDISQSSFAFVAIQDDWSHTESGTALRTLVEGKLIDVSPVVTPAYEDTSVGLRSLSRAVGASYEEVERLAEKRELRKFFIRTDKDGGAPTPGSTARALMRMRGLRPDDPYDLHKK
jgi:HK97 family phage prohead protease